MRIFQKQIMHFKGRSYFDSTSMFDRSGVRFLNKMSLKIAGFKTLAEVALSPL